MAGRRFNLPVPHFSTVKDWVKASHILETYLRRLVDTDSGLPTPHQETHLVGGSDALQSPGTPTSITIGGVSSIGNGPSYAREDHSHAFSGADLHAYVMRRVSLRL